MTQDQEIMVPDTHPCLPGHFPGHPVVPGVVILDLLREVILQWNPAVHITGITLVKFNHPLLPGQKARVHLEKLSKRIRFQIYRQDRLLAQGEFRCEAG